ncbi:MAG: G5 domain-containing protein, partial [Candidatus Riflebacteria bacterium]|nr:G5 domain-containing protein [Candidatus Riflebacteria bacterium]
FKFTNGLNIPILITSTSGEGWVEVSIYAEKKPFESIELFTRNEVKKPFKTEKRINSKLKSGEVKVVHPGVVGYTVEAYRTITSIDGKSKEERLSKDNYLTYNRIEERSN